MLREAAAAVEKGNEIEFVFIFNDKEKFASAALGPVTFLAMASVRAHQYAAAKMSPAVRESNDD